MWNSMMKVTEFNCFFFVKHTHTHTHTLWYLWLISKMNQKHCSQKTTLQWFHNIIFHIMSPSWKLFKFPSSCKWINRFYYSHKIQCYWARVKWPMETRGHVSCESFRHVEERKGHRVQTLWFHSTECSDKIRKSQPVQSNQLEGDSKIGWVDRKLQMVLTV